MIRHRTLLCLTAAAVATLGPRPLSAQPAQARIKIDTERVIGEVHPHVFGNFVEQLGRCIYGGVFEERARSPTPTATARTSWTPRTASA